MFKVDSLTRKFTKKNNLSQKSQKTQIYDTKGPYPCVIWDSDFVELNLPYCVIIRVPQKEMLRASPQVRSEVTEFQLTAGMRAKDEL